MVIPRPLTMTLRCHMVTLMRGAIIRADKPRLRRPITATPRRMILMPRQIMAPHRVMTTARPKTTRRPSLTPAIITSA